MNKDDVKFSCWQHKVNNGVTKNPIGEELRRIMALDPEGPGAIAAARLIFIKERLRSLSPKYFVARPHVPFPVIYRDAGISVAGGRPRIWASRLGMTAILLEVGLLFDSRDEKEKTDRALSRASSWARGCPGSPGVPYPISYLNFLESLPKDEASQLPRSTLRSE